MNSINRLVGHWLSNTIIFFPLFIFKKSTSIPQFILITYIRDMNWDMLGLFWFLSRSQQFKITGRYMLTQICWHQTPWSLQYGTGYFLPLSPLFIFPWHNLSYQNSLLTLSFLKSHSYLFSPSWAWSPLPCFPPHLMLVPLNTCQTKHMPFKTAKHANMLNVKMNLWYNTLLM